MTTGETPGRGAPDRPDSPRERLLQAARDVVAADGLEGLTLRAIARRAGVSHGAPLRHFPSLASLLAAVGADGFVRLMDTVDEHLAAADGAAAEAGHVLGPRRRLTEAARAYVQFALTDPGVFSVTFRPELVDVTDEEYQRQGAASFQQLVDLVEAVQADGWQPDRPSDEVAAVLWAQVHGLAVLALHGALGAVVADHDGTRRGAGGPRSRPGEELPLRLAVLSTQLSIGDDPDPTDPPTHPPVEHRAPSDTERDERTEETTT
jgi:AcrR family transcriptional regulator